MRTRNSPRRTNPISVIDTDNARLPQRNGPRRIVTDGPSFKLTGGFSPVILTSGEVTVSPGAVAIPDHGKLQPFARSAMLVDEIHVNARAAPTTVTLRRIDARWLLRLQISLGRLALTNGFVPLAAIEHSYLNNNMYGCSTIASTDFAGKSITGSHWKLPVPLYVPAGSLLYTQLQMSAFYLFASSNATTIIADVTYVGRLLPVDYPVPSTIKVPYVTAIQSADAATQGTQQTLLESKDLQLGNPFDTPMFAQRMVMRNYEIISIGGGDTAFVEAYNGGSPSVTLRGTFNNTDISIANALNHYVVFDDGFTPSVLASLGHHTLSLYNTEMRPKDRFDLTIDSRSVTMSDATVAAAGLVGWRNEVL